MRFHRFGPLPGRPESRPASLVRGACGRGACVWCVRGLGALVLRHGRRTGRARETQMREPPALDNCVSSLRVSLRLGSLSMGHSTGCGKNSGGGKCNCGKKKKRGPCGKKACWQGCKCKATASAKVTVRERIQPKACLSGQKTSYGQFVVALPTSHTKLTNIRFLGYECVPGQCMPRPLVAIGVQTQLQGQAQIRCVTQPTPQHLTLHASAGFQNNVSVHGEKCATT